MVAGVASGGVTTLSASRMALLLFLPLLLIPTALRFLIEGSAVSLAMGAMTLLYLALVFSSARRLNDNIRDNISLRLDAASREQVLREQERQLRSITDSITEGILVLDADASVCFANPRAGELLGQSRDELIGHGFEFSESSGAAREIQVQRPDGSQGWLEVTVAEAHWQGQPALVVALHDISDRKQAEAARRTSEHRYRELFDNMSNGVVVYRIRGDGEDVIIEELNRAGERITGVTRDAIIGSSVRKAFPGVEELGLYQIFVDVWRSGKPRHLPPSKYRDEQHSMWVENYI